MTQLQAALLTVSLQAARVGHAGPVRDVFISK